MNSTAALESVQGFVLVFSYVSVSFSAWEFYTVKYRCSSPITVQKGVHIAAQNPQTECAVLLSTVHQHCCVHLCTIECTCWLCFGMYAYDTWFKQEEFSTHKEVTAKFIRRIDMLQCEVDELLEENNVSTWSIRYCTFICCRTTTCILLLLCHAQL